MSDIDIPLSEIKQHCRIDESDTLDDALLTTYAEAALEVCQQHIGKRFDNGLVFTPAIKVGCLLYMACCMKIGKWQPILSLKKCLLP